MPNLPTEIVEDILRRLQVKALKRCRAVAKSWCLMIDSQDFVKVQLRQSLLTNSNRKLLLGGLALYTIDLGLFDKAHSLKPPFYYKTVDEISNSCNGLVLVMGETPILWNPFSVDYKVLPRTSVEHETPFDSYAKTFYGFAYDAKSDDYKVVRIVEFRHNATHGWMASEAKIFSVRSNLWRRIEDFAYPIPFLKGNWRVHVNGALHTLVQDVENLGSPHIMAFSVEAEKHYKMAMPPGIRILDFDVSLDVLDGCLCIVCTNRSRAVIWVMKDYGVKESWFRLLSVRPPVLDRHEYLKPLLYSEDRAKVLLNWDDKRLVWYDLVKKTCTDVIVDGFPFVFYAEVVVETLVSPNSPDEVKILCQEKIRQEKRKEKSKQNRNDFLSEGFKLVL